MASKRMPLRRVASYGSCTLLALLSACAEPSARSDPVAEQTVRELLTKPAIAVKWGPPVGIDMHLEEMERVVRLGARAIPALRRAVEHKRDREQWLALRPVERIDADDFLNLCVVVLQQPDCNLHAGWIAFMALEEVRELLPQEKLRFLHRAAESGHWLGAGYARRLILAMPGGKPSPKWTSPWVDDEEGSEGTENANCSMELDPSTPR
jgi:hypothetical protein